MHRTLEELEAGLDEVRAAPRDLGTVELIVRRPTREQREVLETATLDLDQGVLGDNWLARGNRHTVDGSAKPLEQIAIMGARAAALLAGPKERWPLAGDQFYVDLDLSEDNVPAGTRLHIGNAVLEVTEAPHTACAKFASRFGADALRLAYTPVGRALNIRGINTRVITPGTVTIGASVTKAAAG